MRGRKYIVVIGFSWLILLALGFALVTDGKRMDKAEEEHIAQLAARGAEIYAQNCIVCHGVSGQGHIGPPLNIAGLRGDPREDTDVYEMLYSTIAHGRPGSGTPAWELLSNGEWASYTAMPAWSQESDGTLNEQHLRALAHFIMAGDWKVVSRYIPDENMKVDSSTGRVDREATIAALPQGVDISEEASYRGRQLFYDRACISCHAIGGIGHTIGPDLSMVGAWPVNLTEDEWRAFLSQWIADPSSVVYRAPTQWSNYEGPIQVDPDEVRDVDLPPTEMPALGLSEDEIDDLVTYLLSLK